MKWEERLHLPKCDVATSPLALR